MATTQLYSLKKHVSRGGKGNGIFTSYDDAVKNGKKQDDLCVGAMG